MSLSAAVTSSTISPAPTSAQWAAGQVPPDGDLAVEPRHVDLGYRPDVERVLNGVLRSALTRARSDHAVRSTYRRQLSEARTAAAALDPNDPRAQDRAQFAAGLEHGVIALFSGTAEAREEYVIARLQRDMGSPPARGFIARVEREMTSKRTSKASRAEWAHSIREMPDGPMRRGMLVAGTILAGQDAWWGLRDSPPAALDR